MGSGGWFGGVGCSHVGGRLELVATPMHGTVGRERSIIAWLAAFAALAGEDGSHGVP